MKLEPYDPDPSRCREVWASAASGLSLQCGRELGHVGACRCGGLWRDQSEARPTQTGSEGQ